MNTINKIKQYKKFYFDYNIERPEIEVSEIRESVNGKVESLEGIEFLIRIQTAHGRNNGVNSKSAAMGSKYEYYGLKDGKIVETPFFAPDHRYYKQTNVEDCRCLELEDELLLNLSDDKIVKKRTNSTNVFRACFEKKAEKYDKKHGSNNWWAEGTTKTGFDVYFKP